MSVSNMTLLSALLELSQHAEGRRVELKHLRTAVGRLCSVIVAMLRAGDEVTVDSRVYEVVVITVKGKPEKVLAVNCGVLGDVRPVAPSPYATASLEDTTVFAAHAEKVIITFFMTLENQHRELSKAEQRVSDLLRDGWMHWVTSEGESDELHAGSDS